MRSFFSFPNPVNEKAARVVAAGVVVQALVTIALGVTAGWAWLTVPLAYGFWARVLTGPRLSPLGQLATQVIAPRLGAARPVPGTPKRFAQGIGTAFTTAAAIAWLGFGAQTLAVTLLLVLTGFALLEAALGFCAGCYAFGWLVRWGVLPVPACEVCSDIRLRVPASV